MEVHNGLSGVIAESAECDGRKFDALWCSSLTSSVSKGKPDIECVSTGERLELVREVLEVTTLPLVYDGDTGGEPEVLHFTVRSLEQLGVSAIVIEDKAGLKQNSLFGEERRQQLEAVDTFCTKLRAALSARRSADFMVVARIEALIAGAGQDEAVRRAQAYVGAGASAIFISSKETTAEQLLGFLAAYRSALGSRADNAS